MLLSWSWSHRSELEFQRHILYLNDLERRVVRYRSTWSKNPPRLPQDLSLGCERQFGNIHYIHSHARSEWYFARKASAHAFSFAASGCNWSPKPSATYSLTGDGLLKTLLKNWNPLSNHSCPRRGGAPASWSARPSCATRRAEWWFWAKSTVIVPHVKPELRLNQASWVQEGATIVGESFTSSCQNMFSTDRVHCRHCCIWVPH